MARQQRNMEGDNEQRRVDTRGEGKRGPGTSGKPRPGNRKTDPKRTDDWG